MNDLDRICTVTGRVGMAVDRALYYVRGGYAAGRLGVSLSEGSLVRSITRLPTPAGPVVGLLVAASRALITNNVTIGVAYDYIDLFVVRPGSATFTQRSACLRCFAT